MTSSVCQRQFAHHSSLSRHFKMCMVNTKTTTTTTTTTNDEVLDLSSGLRDVVESINEIKQMLSQGQGNKTKSTSGKPGTVYVVHEREFVEGNKPIFKVGSIESTSD